jgi:hypothetical protein
MIAIAPLGRRLLETLAVLAALLAWCGTAWADPPGRVGRLADLSGNVWLYDPVEGEWIAAARNRPLTTGDRLATDDDARAEVQVGSTTLRLDGSTDIEIVQLDDAALRVRLQDGTLALRVRAQEWAQEIEVTTAHGRFAPTSAGHYRIDRDDDSTAATSWSGGLRFEADDSTLNISSGERAEFWSDAGVTHYTWSSVQHDNFAQWAASEDRRESVSSQYVSPEMTGAEDLDRHGRWDRHPDYGPLWIPYHVAPGWAPYRAGHWSWISPWGWTWVDHAPWGFAPFHYGRWVSWRGRWCWAPGSFVARPIFAPALVAWIGSRNVSVGVRVGSRPPLVGWVPLGPRGGCVPDFRRGRIFIRNVNITHVHLPPDRVVPPREPVMYTNRGVPGGVTVVPADVLRERRPVSTAVVAPDTALARQLGDERPGHEAPPAPVRRVGGAARAAVPVVPGVMDSRREREPMISGNGAQARDDRPARVAVPAPRSAPQTPFVPRSGERQSDESSVRRPGEGALTTSPSTLHERPSASQAARPQVREDTRSQPPRTPRALAGEDVRVAPQQVRPVPRMQPEQQALPSPRLQHSRPQRVQPQPVQPSQPQRALPVQPQRVQPVQPQPVQPQRVQPVMPRPVMPAQPPAMQAAQPGPMAVPSRPQEGPRATQERGDGRSGPPSRPGNMRQQVR